MRSNRCILAWVLILPLIAPGISTQTTATVAPQPAAVAPLTNDDIIALASVKLGDDAIIAKIRTAPSTNFDTSIAGLTRLKTAGVTSYVIRFMIDPPTHGSTTPKPSVTAPPSTKLGAATPPTNPDDPLTSHSQGIYIVGLGFDGANHLIKLERINQKQTKTSGSISSELTGGMAKTHTKAVFDGAHAEHKMTSSQNKFYIYLPESNESFNGGSIRATDFVLLKLDIKDITREIDTSSHSMMGSSSGADHKSMQAFTAEKIKPGITRLTLNQPLVPGEYAFQGTMGYFDFGVVPAK